MDWAFYAVGITAHLYTLLGIINIATLMNDYRVKFGRATMEIHNSFYIGCGVIIFFWCWMIWG